MKNEIFDEYNGPIFVIGSPRSGTKLLMRLLNNHPDILLANEFGAHASLLKKWHNKISAANINNLFNDITSTTYYIGNKMRGWTFTKKEFLEEINDYNIANILLVFLRTMASKIENKPFNTTIIGQKSPYLINKVDVLSKYYKKSKFIYIIRDVRNCAISSKKVWNKDIYRYSQRWYDTNIWINNYFNKLDSNEFIIVKYEDLISKTGFVLKQICAFLNIKYFEKIVELQKQSENYGEAKGIIGIIKQDDKKYEKYLSKREILKVESITFPLLRNFGYSYDYNAKLVHLHSFHLRFLQIKDIMNRLLFDLKEKGFLKFFYIIKLHLSYFKK